MYRCISLSIERDLLRQAPANVERTCTFGHAMQVAILCNHQRAVPKTHEKSMENMQEKYDTAAKALKDAQADLKRVQAGKETQNGKKRRE